MGWCMTAVLLCVGAGIARCRFVSIIRSAEEGRRVRPSKKRRLNGETPEAGGRERGGGVREGSGAERARSHLEDGVPYEAAQSEVG